MFVDVLLQCRTPTGGVIDTLASAAAYDVLINCNNYDLHV